MTSPLQRQLKTYLRKVCDLRAYFRGAEYPMGRLEAWWEAARFARRWP